MRQDAVPFWAIAFGKGEVSSASGINMLNFAAVALLILWFVRLCRLLVQLWDLEAAVAHYGVMRTRHGSFLGEMEMFWGGDWHQQVLRARNKPKPITIQELSLPFAMDTASLRLKRSSSNDHNGSETLGLEFKYTSSDWTECEILWNVCESELSDCIDVCNGMAIRPSSPSSSPSGGTGWSLDIMRRKWRLKMGFGAGPASNSRGYTALEEGWSPRHGRRRYQAEGQPADSQDESGSSPWGAMECLWRSEAIRLPPGAGMEFSLPQAAQVPSPACRSIRVACCSQERVQGGNTIHPAVMIARSNRAMGGCAVAQLFVLELEVRPGGPGAVLRQHSVVDGVCYTHYGVYGQGLLCGAGGEEDGECVICFSEPRDTCLLPCRHLCVCEGCFTRLAACPVCRAPFTAYLRPKPADKPPEREPLQ